MATAARFAVSSPVPISASETLATRWTLRDLLETGVAGLVMLVLSWCGGLSGARKVAAMALHDCTGPVVLCASTHLSLNAPNGLTQASVRAFAAPDTATSPPPPANRQGRQGHSSPGPGLGTELNPDLDRAFVTSRKISNATTV